MIGSNYQFQVIPFRNMYIMYFVKKTKYTLSLKFVPAQVIIIGVPVRYTSKNFELSHPDIVISFNLGAR
jgi:hypothetical protein